MIDLEKALGYEMWASRRILARLREIPDPAPELIRLFAHTQTPLKVWGTRNVVDCALLEWGKWISREATHSAKSDLPQ